MSYATLPELNEVFTNKKVAARDSGSYYLESTKFLADLLKKHTNMTTKLSLAKQQCDQNMYFAKQTNNPEDFKKVEQSAEVFSEMAIKFQAIEDNMKTAKEIVQLNTISPNAQNNGYYNINLNKLRDLVFNENYDTEKVNKFLLKGQDYLKKILNEKTHQ